MSISAKPSFGRLILPSPTSNQGELREIFQMNWEKWDWSIYSEFLTKNWDSPWSTMHATLRELREIFRMNWEKFSLIYSACYLEQCCMLSCLVWELGFKTLNVSPFYYPAVKEQQCRWMQLLRLYVLLNVRQQKKYSTWKIFRLHQTHLGKTLPPPLSFLTTLIVVSNTCLCSSGKWGTKV